MMIGDMSPAQRVALLVIAALVLIAATIGWFVVAALLVLLAVLTAYR